MLSPHITPLTVSHFNMHLNLKSARQIAPLHCYSAGRGGYSADRATLSTR